MDLVGSYPSGGADRIVAYELDVGKVHSPGIMLLTLMDDHSQHVHHYVIGAWGGRGWWRFYERQELVHKT